MFQDSPDPFLCSVCFQSKQVATVKDMQQKIESLTAEILELRAAVEAIPSHSETRPPVTNTVNNATSTMVVHCGQQ